MEFEAARELNLAMGCAGLPDDAVHTRLQQQVYGKGFDAGPSQLGRSVGPCKKYLFLGFYPRLPGLGRHPDSSPVLSVGLPGASGGLPEAPGT